MVSASLSLATTGQPFCFGSVLEGPGWFGQASMSSVSWSPSASLGGQPFLVESLLAAPATVGQASVCIQNRVAIGVARCKRTAIKLMGSRARNSQFVAHTHLRRRRSRRDRGPRRLDVPGAEPFSPCGNHSIEATTRTVGAPMPRVRPGPAPAPIRQSSVTRYFPPNSTSNGVVRRLKKPSPPSLTTVEPKTSGPISNRFSITRTPSAAPKVSSLPNGSPATFH